MSGLRFTAKPLRQDRLECMGIRSFIKRKVNQRLTPSDVGPAPLSKVADTRSLPRAADSQGFSAVLRVDDLVDGQGRTVAVGSAAIAVFRSGEAFFAVDDACTHEDAPLGEGKVHGTTVTCPYHDWVFDFRDGRCITYPDRYVGCFTTKVHDGFVWVGARTSEGSTERGGDHADGLNTSKRPS
jgi:nitrite reductase (NADH) small subunit